MDLKYVWYLAIWILPLEGCDVLLNDDLRHVLYLCDVASVSQLFYVFHPHLLHELRKDTKLAIIPAWGYVSKSCLDT